MFMSMSVLGTTVLGTCSYLGRDLIEILPGSQNVHVSHSGAQGTVSAASAPGSGLPRISRTKVCIYWAKPSLFWLPSWLRAPVRATPLKVLWFPPSGRCVSRKPRAPRGAAPSPRGASGSQRQGLAPDDSGRNACSFRAPLRGSGEFDVDVDSPSLVRHSAAQVKEHFHVPGIVRNRPSERGPHSGRGRGCAMTGRRGRDVLVRLIREDIRGPGSSSALELGPRRFLNMRFNNLLFCLCDPVGRIL